VINLFHSLLTKSNKVSGLSHSFFRTTAPNVSGLLAMVIVFLIFLFVQVSKSPNLLTSRLDDDDTVVHSQISGKRKLCADDVKLP
jgi:hypothetical protein